MKVLILLAIVAVARSTVLRYAPAAVLETGASAQYRSEDNFGNYNFGYNEDHTSGGTFRREAGDAHGNVAGSYGLRDADGRVRVVNYIADDTGFRADIKTNEPGVEPKDPADATINKAETVAVKTIAVAPAVHAPVVAVAEPAPVAVKSAYAFPAPAAAVQKTSSLTYTAPVAIAEPAHVVAEPVAYAFPEPAPVAVQKSSVAVVEQAPVAKTSVTTYTSKVAAPVAVAEQAHIAYTFPEPAAVPVAKTSVAVAEAAPVSYTFPAVEAPVAKSLTYAAPVAVPVATGHSKISYSSQVQVNHAPALRAVAYAPAHYAYSAPAHYSHGYYAPSAILKSTGLRYATHNPYFYGLHSPVVSTFAGPVPYFTNIEYPGYPILKK